MTIGSLATPVGNLLSFRIGFGAFLASHFGGPRVDLTYDALSQFLEPVFLWTFQLGHCHGIPAFG